MGHTLMLCYGTRPQVIKASVLRRVLDPLAPVCAVDTGQHYDYALNALLYEQLGVQPPDLYLEVGSGTHAEQTAAIMTRTEAVLREKCPRAVIVIGDTNSTLGCALAAAKLRIPVVHVEAGLRASDSLMAEEINRRVVDTISSVLCTPSAAATARLRTEQRHSTVVETGDVSYDVLLLQRERLSSIDPLLAAPYVFTTLHRAELTSDLPVLRGVLQSLGALPYPVCLAAHPRTLAVLGESVAGDAYGPALRIMPAVGYLESLRYIQGASVVVTDSGGIQRESYWLGVPCVTIRSETEWLETVSLGANVLVPPAEAPRLIATTVEGRMRQPRGTWDRAAYGDGRAAMRIAAAVRQACDL